MGPESWGPKAVGRRFDRGHDARDASSTVGRRTRRARVDARASVERIATITTLERVVSAASTQTIGAVPSEDVVPTLVTDDQVRISASVRVLDATDVIDSQTSSARNAAV